MQILLNNFEFPEFIGFNLLNPIAPDHFSTAFHILSTILFSLIAAIISGIASAIFTKKYIVKQHNEWLTTLSHELKTPLTSLKEGISLALEYGPDSPTPFNSEQNKKILSLCRDSTKILEVEINNLLKGTKLELGYYELARQSLVPKELIQNVLHHLQPIALRRGRTIEVFSHCPRTMVICSLEGLSHVIANLVMNALKYSKPNSCIKISTKEIKDKYIEIKVTNSGLLPKLTSQKSLFKRFFQLNSSEQLFGNEGVGFGLHLVEKIIRHHGGKISIETYKDTTSFSFQIPIIAHHLQTLESSL